MLLGKVLNLLQELHGVTDLPNSSVRESLHEVSCPNCTAKQFNPLCRVQQSGKSALINSFDITATYSLSLGCVG